MNSRLAVEAEFPLINDNDPFRLFQLIKAVVMSRSMGNAVKDKANALHDWHTLALIQGEQITTYSRRTTILECLTHAKIPAAELPSGPEQYAMKLNLSMD